jgi:hypothetical protein
MDKPKEGDILTVIDPAVSLGEYEHTVVRMRVIAVYDSLDINEPGGNWDPWGELAWQQMDHDEEVGKTGEWYIAAERVDEAGNTLYEGEMYSLGSYEVTT